MARRSDGTLYAAKYQKIKDKRTQRLVGIPEMISEKEPVECLLFHNIWLECPPPPDLIPDSLLKDCDCHSPEIERKVNSNEWDRS